MSTDIPITFTTTPHASSPASIDGPVRTAPYIQFPPFPAPPPGVTITSFTKFKPAGIPANPARAKDEPELDGLGIPTAALGVRHDTVDAERRKRTKGAKPDVPQGEPRLPPWFEEWDFAEQQRRTSVPIDPCVTILSPTLF